MKLLRIVALYFMVFNSLWLALLFGVLYQHGQVLIVESARWVAAGELVLCLVTAGIGIVVLFRKPPWS